MFRYLQGKYNQQISIIGPRQISTKYKAVLNAIDLKFDEDLYIGLKSNKSFFDIQKFQGRDAENFHQEVEFELPSTAQNFYAYKLIGLLVKQKGRKNECVRREMPIIASTQNYFVLIQTDKVVYKPGDTVQFRVLVLDYKTKPFKYNKIDVKFINNNEKLSRNFLETNQLEFGLYENAFNLPETSSVGKWRIEVTVDGNERSSIKSFMVKEFTPPPFQVFIETAPLVAFEVPQPVIDLKIYGKLQSNILVTGSVKINTKVYLVEDPEDIQIEKSSKTQITEGSKVVRFDLKSDIGLNFLIKPAIVEFEVELTQDGTGKKSKQSQKVEVIPVGRNYIVLDKHETFKPGFSYKIKALVYDINAELEQSSSKPLTLRVTYNFKYQRETETTETEVFFLKNGKATFSLYPEEDVMDIKLRFEFEKFIHEETIKPQKNIEEDTEFMQIFYEPERPKIGDILNITAESNGLFESLNVIVIGLNGLVYSKHFVNAASAKTFNFNLKITQEMAPEATVIVFYVRDQDGDIVYDELNVGLGFTGKNFLTLETSKQTLKGNEEAQLTLKTQPQSLVGLLAVDQTAKFIGSNEINSKEINSKLDSSPKLKFKSDISISKAVVVQFAKGRRRNCFSWENDFIKKANQGSFKVNSADDDNFEESFPAQNNEPINYIDDTFSKYFPDVWLFETLKVDEQVKQVSRKVPEQNANWTISGFSINAEYGLAIAEPQEIRVHQDFFLKADFPSSLKVGEVFKLDVQVFNYLDDRQNVELSINADDKFLEMVDEEKTHAGCFEYKKIPTVSKRLTINSQATGKHVAFIRAVKDGKVIINIEANGQGVSDKIEKITRITNEGITQFKSTPMLINLKNNQLREEISVDLPADIEQATVKIEASLSGNILGPLLENNERFDILPKEGLEEKIRNLALSVYTYKQIKLINRAKEAAADKALENVRRNYQEIKSLQSTNGGFELFINLTEGTWITAYIANILGDASTFISIDAEVMQNLLGFLKNKQFYPNVFFNENGLNLRPLQGGDALKKVYLTAFVLIGVLKNKNYENYGEFEFMISDALDYFKNPTIGYDYEKSVVAYALALADKDILATQAIVSMNWSFLNFETSKIKALQVEIASYALLACLKLGREADAIKAFNWLIKQRKPNGGFFSSHDTVLGLQALSAMSEHLGVQNPSINIQFTGRSGSQSEEIDNFASSKTIQLQSTDRQFNIFATGRGLVYINLFAEYKLKAITSKFSILLTPTSISNGLRLEIRIRSLLTNMAIVDIELPSGYEYSKHTVSEDVMMVEISKDKNQALIYLKKFSSTDTLVIEAVKVLEVRDSKKYIVRAYDYHEPDLIQAISTYEVPNQLNCETSTSRFISDGEGNARNNWNNRSNQSQSQATTQNTQRSSPEFSTFYWTTAVMENQNLLCVASLVTQKAAITLSSCLQHKEPFDIKLRSIHKSRDGQQVDDKYVKNIINGNGISAVVLYSNVQSESTVRIPTKNLDFSSSSCIVSAWNDRIDDLIKKETSFIDCNTNTNRNERICVENGLEKIGNPLVCSLNGNLYQVGVGLGDNQYLLLQNFEEFFKMI